MKPAWQLAMRPMQSTTSGASAATARSNPGATVEVEVERRQGSVGDAGQLPGQSAAGTEGEQRSRVARPPQRRASGGSTGARCRRCAGGPGRRGFSLLRRMGRRQCWASLMSRHPWLNLLMRWSILAVGVALSALIVPGITYDSGVTLLVVVALLSLFNAILKPLLVIFTLPFVVLSSVSASGSSMPSFFSWSRSWWRVSTCVISGRPCGRAHRQPDEFIPQRAPPRPAGAAARVTAEARRRDRHLTGSPAAAAGLVG